MTQNKKFSKVLVILSTLLAALVLLVTLGTGCSAIKKDEKYTFANSSELGYFYLRYKDDNTAKVQLWNVWVYATYLPEDDVREVSFHGVEGTATFTKDNSAENKYKVVVNVPDFTFEVSYYDIEVPEVVYYRGLTKVVYKLGETPAFIFSADDGSW